MVSHYEHLGWEQEDLEEIKYLESQLKTIESKIKKHALDSKLRKPLQYIANDLKSEIIREKQEYERKYSRPYI